MVRLLTELVNLQKELTGEENHELLLASVDFVAFSAYCHLPVRWEGGFSESEEEEFDHSEGPSFLFLLCSALPCPLIEVPNEYNA